MKSFVLCMLLLVSLGNVIAGPAPPIYVLRILPKYTQCHRDGSMSIYYGRLGYGRVYALWNGSSTRCKTIQYITGPGRIIKGWYDKCTVKQQTGKFTVKYYGNRGLLLCNTSYDSVTYTNCRKTSHPCALALG